MLDGRPSRPTSLTPAEIIGVAMAYDFKRHYTVCSSGTMVGEFPEKLLNKEFGAETRAQIADIYRDLRSNGFYPDGFTQHGEIRWKVALEDKGHRILLDTVVTTPKDSLELEAMISNAREEFTGIGSVVGMAS